MQKALLIDGNSILNRSFYGIRNMSTKDGFPTNAVYGFIKTLDKMISSFNPEYIVVSFDLKKKTFRHEMFKEYKGTRKPMPEELRLQFPVIKDILRSMGIVILEKEGYEADDIIGTLSAFFSGKNIQTYVLSGDKDLMQLVGDKVTMYYAGTKNEGLYDSDRVHEILGVYPDRVTDLKGLMGDSSDNIPGVAGVGPKTAVKLLDEYATLENVLSHVDDISAKKLREKLLSSKDIALLSKQLASIKLDVPLDMDLTSFVKADDNVSELFDYYSKYEFKTFLSALNMDDVREESLPSTEELPVTLNDTDLLSKLDFDEDIFFEVIRDYTDPLIKKANYLMIYQEGAGYHLFDESAISSVMTGIRSHSSGKTVKIKAHDSKKVMLLFRAFDILNYEVLYDYEIASYIMDPNRRNHDVSDEYNESFGVRIVALDDFYKKSSSKKSGLSLDVESVKDVLSQRINALVKTEALILDKISEMKMMDIYTDIDLPLASLLVDMQIEGFRIDVDVLNAIGKELDSVISTLEADIYFNCGQEFNINSPKQLGIVLFEDLGIKPGKKTKTGYSTAKDILEKKIDEHPVIKMILDYRTYTKMKSTYIDGLKPLINKKTSKIHSYFMQTVAATGRISSVNPNLQNIPMRYEAQRKLRKAFIPRSSDYLILAADYSQIELRLLAHLSQSKELINAFNEDVDIHALTASKVFGVEIEEVTKELRTRAKAVNFGVVYGIGGYSLSEDLDISFYEAQNYIESYFEQYPMIRDYLEGLREFASTHGYAETLYGRRRGVPELSSSNYMTREYGKRIAMNSPIQGAASDIIKIAMVNVSREIKRLGLKSRLILQVHDELVFDAHKDELDELKDLVVSVMTESFDLLVRLDVNIEIGENWYEAK